MNIEKSVLRIIKLEIEIEIKNFLRTYGQLNENHKLLINECAEKMYKDYDNDNELNEIIDQKLPPDAYREYINYERLVS